MHTFVCTLFRMSIVCLDQDLAHQGEVDPGAEAVRQGDVSLKTGSVKPEASAPQALV